MSEQRTYERLKAHYEVEKALAAELRHAAPAARRRLYATLYDELFRRVPDHPQLTRKQSAADRRRAAARELARIRRYLKPGTTFLEVGAGDCALAFAAAGLVGQVYGLDVSAEIAQRAHPPQNFQLVLSDGCSVPVPPGSVHVAYSNQLIEHLHPEDAAGQLRNIWEALAPGGVYICLTPNRLSGPHDISRYFDAVATGFHLREYTLAELSQAFQQAGFARRRVLLPAGRRAWALPLFPFLALEAILRRLPPAYQRRLANLALCDWLLGIRLVGVK